MDVTKDKNIEVRVKKLSTFHLIFGLTLLAFGVYFVVVSAIILYNTTPGTICRGPRIPDRQIGNYESLREALENGEKLRIVMDYSKMSFFMNDVQVPTVDEKSGFDLEDFQYFGRMSINNPLAYIITSFNKLVIHQTYGAIYNYGKMRIFEDEYFELISYFIRPTDFSILELKSFNGTLKDGSVLLARQNRY